MGNYGTERGKAEGIMGQAEGKQGDHGKGRGNQGSRGKTVITGA